MATETVRDGRFLRQKDLTTDYTLTLTNVDDGQLLLSNNMKSINVIDDIGNALLRKVDHWDDMPDLSQTDLSISMGYLGRTVAYTGDTKQITYTKKSGESVTMTFEKGCLYKCIPDPEYTWTALEIGMSAQLLKCEESVQIAGMSESDYLLISNVDKNARCIIFYGLDGSSNPVMKMAMGAKTVAEAKEKTSIIVYRYSDGKWNRTNDLNEYTCIFNNCTVTYTTANLGMLFKGHVNNTTTDPVPAFHWELITNDEVQIASPYETVYPIDNTCYLSGIPSCFQFGQVSSSSDSFIITLDSSDLAVGQYYNNNIIYFETLTGFSLSFEGIAGGISKTVEMIGDSASEAGKFRVSIEVTPDGSMVADVKRLGDATVTAETTPITLTMMSASRTYYYGIKVRLTDDNNQPLSTPEVTKIEMTRSRDANNNIVETITELASDSDFTSRPCHTTFKRCVVKDFTNSTPAYFLYPSNSIYKADGKTYADLTGEDGDVAVQIKKCYLRITKPKNSTDDYSLDHGTIYYLISTTAIPDPVDDSIVVFNDVHPLFRVGGTVLSDQYETEYDELTGTRVATTTPLRSIRNSIYVGAFASVRCFQGTEGLLPKTLKAFSLETSDDSSYITASDTRGSYEDYANYPKMKSGVPCGYVADSTAKDYSIKKITYKNTQARSVAPYRNGDFVYVGIPGVILSITSDNPAKPDDFAGGAVIEMYGNAERSYSYRLTTDTTFQEKKPYFTKNSDGTYSKATVVIGSTIPSDTYYTRYFIPAVTDEYTYKKSDVDSSGTVSTTTFTLSFKASGTTSNIGNWQLKKSSTVLATSSECTVNSAFSFNDLIWTWADGSATIGMKSVDSVYKLYHGPMTYGTRKSDFSWLSQSSWDDAISGNPNWTLNYRPIVGLPRADYQILHGNGYNDTLSEYYAYTQLTGDCLNSSLSAFVFPNNGTTCSFKFSPNITQSKAVMGDASSVWYGLTSQNSMDGNCKLVWNPEYDGWTYSDTYSNIVSMDISTGTPFKPYTKTADDTIKDNKIYFLRDNSDVGPDFTYTQAENPTVGGDTVWYSATTDTHFMNGKTYYTRTGSGTTSDPYKYNVVTVTIGGVITGTYYEQRCFYEVSAPSPIDCQFVNGLYKYVDFYDPGFRNDGAYFGESDSAGTYGITLGTWQNYDTGLTHTGDKFAMTYLYREASIEYNLSFNHPSMRWVIKRQDPTGDVSLYQSNRINPSTFTWGGHNFVAVSDNTYFYPVNYLRDVALATGNIAIGLIPDITSGAAMKTFAYTNASDNIYEREWTKVAEAGASTPTYIKLEYILPTDTRIIASGGTLGTTYGGCWALVKYTNSEYTAVASVLGSDMDVVAALCKKGTNNVFIHGLFRPLNPEDRDTQRTYDSETKKATNNSLIYESVMCADGSMPVIQLMYIGDNDENKLPTYITSRTAQYPISAINSITANYKNRWVALKFNKNGNVYTLVTDDGTQSASIPFGWSTLGTNVPPSSPYLNFTFVNGATTRDGTAITNKKLMHFRNTPLIAFKAKSSGRAYTANARFKSFLALMMVIDCGTYDIYNALSHGKRLMNISRSITTGPITFSGRTATCGNNTQAVIYDRDIDINIVESDFGSTTSADRIVAFSYRGIENPFGNIGEFDEGIIPVKRYIDGSLIDGYFECTDPGAYSDKLSYLTMARYSYILASSDPIAATYYDFQPSGEYSWRPWRAIDTNNPAIPVSGWAKRLFPDVGLIRSVGATAPSTTGTFVCGYWLYNYESMWNANANGHSLYMLHVPFSSAYNSMYSMGFSYGAAPSATGARLEY